MVNKMWNSLEDSDDYDPKGDMLGSFITMFIVGFIISLLIF